MSTWSGSSVGFHYDEHDLQDVYDAQTAKLNPVDIILNKQRQPASSIMDYLERNPNYKAWVGLIKKSGYDKLYRDPNRLITAFVVSDTNLYQIPAHILHNLDSYSASSLIGFMTAQNVFTSSDFKMTPGLMYLKTYHPYENLLVNSMAFNIRIGRRPLSMSSMPSINADSRIIPERSDVLMGNGVIHEVGYPVVPDRK